MRSGLLLVFAFCIIGFLSCQKELSLQTSSSSGTGTGTGTGGSADSGKILFKAVYIDSSYKDTMQISYLNFDAQKKLKSINDYTFYGGNDSTITNFYYDNDADTLVKKLVGIKHGNTEVERYYKYDASGRVIYDSTSNLSAISGGYYINYVYTFVYTASAITQFGKKYNSNAPNILAGADTTFCSVNYNNGNLLSEKDSSNQTTYYFSKVQNFTFTYDTHAAAHTKGIPKSYSINQNFTVFGSIIPPGFTNNLLSYKIVSDNNLDNMFYNYTMDYNSNGTVKKTDEFYYPYSSNVLIKGNQFLYFYK